MTGQFLSPRLPIRTRPNDRLLTGVVLTATSLVSFGLATRGPTNTALLIAVSLATFGVGVLIISPRYEISLTIILVYLGCLDGFIKLKSGSSYATLGRDVLILAVAGGAAVRLATRKQIKFPPLT